MKNKKLDYARTTDINAEALTFEKLNKYFKTRPEYLESKPEITVLPPHLMKRLCMEKKKERIIALRDSGKSLTQIMDITGDPVEYITNIIISSQKFKTKVDLANRVVTGIPDSYKWDYDGIILLMMSDNISLDKKAEMLDRFIKEAIFELFLGKSKIEAICESLEFTITEKEKLGANLFFTRSVLKDIKNILNKTNTKL